MKKVGAIMVEATLDELYEEWSQNDGWRQNSTFLQFCDLIINMGCEIVSSKEEEDGTY